MTRYIDAEKVTEYLLEHKRVGLENGIVIRADEDAIIIFINEKCETADVQEVKHGKWKQIYEKYPQYVCTACNHLFNNKSFKYCPHCGAKMDGDEN